MSVMAMTLALDGKIGDNTLRPAPRRAPGDRAFMTEDEVRMSALEPAEREALERLLRRGQAGEAAALEELYGLFKARIFGLACRHTYDPVAAEDLLQDIFVRIFTHLGDVRDAGTLSAWIYRISLNSCYSYLRGKRVRTRTMVPLNSVEGGLDAPARDDAGGADLRKAVEGAMGTLPERLRRVFVLHDVEGFKHGEIARILGCTVGTSKSQLFKARMRIRKTLAGMGVM